MILLRHIVSGVVDVVRDTDTWVALGVQDRNPREDYDILERKKYRLGGGGFGEVYRCSRKEVETHKPVNHLKRVVSGDTVAPALTEEVAIKICRSPEKNLSPENLQKLWREVAVMRMLAKSRRCKQLLPLYDAYMWQSTFYIVMPLCPGGKFEVLPDWTEQDVAGVAVQVAKGLQHMHALKCVHHDVKPDNLFLVDTFKPPRVVLGDYGEALITDERATGKRAGGATLTYVPPEYLGGQRKYGTETDVWALGVTVCLLLTNLFPFDVKPIIDANNRFGGAAADRLSPETVRVTEDCRAMRELAAKDMGDARDFVLRCCTFDRSKRPTVEELLRHKWLTRRGLGTEATAQVLQWTQSVVKGLHVLRVQDDLGRATYPGFSPADAAAMQARVEAAGVEGGMPVDAMRAKFHELVPQGEEMDQEQFEQLMTDCGYGTLPLGRLFSVFDRDDSGGVSFAELATGLGLLASVDLHKRVGLVFEIYDTDGDGKLSQEDIAKALASVRTEYSSHQAFRDSVAELTNELIEHMEDGAISRMTLTKIILQKRELLRLFLSPAEAAEEVKRVNKMNKWIRANLGVVGESLVANKWRTLYMVLLAFVFLLLLLHMVQLIDIDALGAAAFRSLDGLMDAPGGVDGSGDTVGDMDYIMRDKRLLDID